MKTTRITTLVTVAAVCALIGWMVERMWVGAGNTLIVPELALPAALVILGVIVVSLSLPVRRRLHGGTSPLNPFYAVNVLVLAKAAAVTGSVFFGLLLGSVLYQLSLPVIAEGGALWRTGVSSAAGLVLAVCGLIAERFCRLPPDENEKGGSGAVTPVGES